MNAQGYAYLDRYAKLQPFSNFLAYHPNFSLTPIELRRKRVLAFTLKKLKKFIYSAENDTEITQVCLSIINYLILSYNPETHKVENALMQLLEDLTFLIHEGGEQMRTQFYNHLTSLSKKKQKYSNAFYYIQRIVGLMTVSNQYSLASDFLLNQYTSSSDHMNNIRFTFLLNTFHAQTSTFELKPYKEKVLKEQSVSTDVILDLANRVQAEESIEEAIQVLKAYKTGDFKGADSFLIKKRFFDASYENGEQLEKEEIIELLEADLFDLEHVLRILSYTEFFLADDDSLNMFIKQLIIRVLKFNYGNTLLWAKLRRLFLASRHNESHLSNIDDEQENEIPEEKEDIDQVMMQAEQADGQNGQQNKRGLKEKLSFTGDEIYLLSKVHFSGKFMKEDMNLLRKKSKGNKDAALFLEHKQGILDLLKSQITEQESQQESHEMVVSLSILNKYEDKLTTTTSGQIIPKNIQDQIQLFESNQSHDMTSN